MKLAALLLIVGCGGSAAPPAKPVDKPAEPVAAGSATSVKVEPCEDPVHLKSAKNTYDCAVELMKRKDYEVAAKLAVSIKERFPYSKLSVLSEELLGDLEVAAEQYDDAVESYELFIKFHPTHEHVEDVKKKLAAARAKAGKAAP